MTHQEFLRVLERRGSAVGMVIPSALAASLGRYFELLAHWNDKVNLTGFDLGNPADAAVDRLFIEPLLACETVEEPVATMLDLGSGGGSPAIPMALALAPRRTVLVETRARKGTFLKEVTRSLDLVHRVDVQVARFEAISVNEAYAGAFDLVTVRAVRLESPEMMAIKRLLRPGGRLLAFHSSEKPPVEIESAGLRVRKTLPLATGGGVISVLTHL